ncbi:hypothetical protein NW762_010632 [Fusarium torreyae]|uniref:Small secreted protein n=1 Tax=Fusarium torreyae TaxID=1237075 RepID=A0A9W8VAB4_9HYPO|nr:hypothetical protein NW762_010632 [Fusarium torreyae]
MLFKSLITIFAATAVAIPAPVAVESVAIPETKSLPVSFDKAKAAKGEQWTVQGLKRYCNKADTECVWKYSVNTYKKGTDPYYCEYTVRGSPASKTDVTAQDGVTCKVFVIQQGYDASGFTTIVPLHPPTGRRIYASFEDWEYVNGHVAKDKTFNVET